MLGLFNYIAFGNVEANVHGDQIQMFRGRMLEYTPADLSARLGDFSREALDFVAQLPTFLCSEIEKRHDQRYSMLVRYGKLTSVTQEHAYIRATFKEEVNFDRLEFETPQEAQKIFGADRFQLNRTHWSVRRGDCEKILDGLIQQLRRSDLDLRSLRRMLPASPEHASPAPQVPEKKSAGTASNISEYLQLIQKTISHQSMAMFYRGHDDITYDLTPSVMRTTDTGGWRYFPNEDKLCNDLLVYNYDDFERDQFCFDRLVRMQHYGLPTRLLDITSNPLIALYFACLDTKSPEGHQSTGEVVTFRIDPKLIKYYHSDTVSCISNLSNLTFAQKSTINLQQDEVSFNETEVAGQLLTHINKEKPYFSGRIRPADLSSIVCVKAKRTNNRIKSQSGAFLLFGHEATLPGIEWEGIQVSRIEIKEKTAILSELDSIGINCASVFPSIEGSADYLRRRHEVESQHADLDSPDPAMSGTFPPPPYRVP